MVAWYISRRKVLQRLHILVAASLAAALIVLLFNASLFRTIPTAIPLFSSIPVYHNHWNYNAPTTVHHPNQNFRAAFVALVDSDHNSVAKLKRTIRDLEDTFNHDHKYPYVVFSPKALITEHKELIASLASGDVVFHTLNQSMYGYANDTDHGRADQSRKRMKNQVVYGDDIHYRFRSRFLAGLIFRHPALHDFDYYWRIDGGTEFPCPISFDPLQYMYEKKIKLSFILATYEPFEAMPSLCETVDKYLEENPSIPAPMYGLVRDHNKKCTRCHFTSSFQIADLNFYRSDAYRAYFDYIDKTNGIFYERWSDSIIQSLGAGLLLEQNEVHHWDSIGFRASQYISHCPKDLWLQCDCHPRNNLDADPLSCISTFSKNGKNE